MCVETAGVMADKERRGYYKLEHLVRTLLVSPAERITVKRTIYLATALVAFAFGLSLGLAIPVYIVPGSVEEPRNLTARGGEGETVGMLSAKGFDGVSFVSPGGTSRPSLARMEDESLVDGIFWGEEIENALPSGYGEPEAERWRRFVRSNPVVKIEEGCGRMQNRLLTFEDGTRACCRYRQNTDQIQGELFSFYLGRLLGLNNLAPSALAVVQSRDPIWSKVRAQISLAQWTEERPVVLTKFIDHLLPAQIPRSLRTPTRKLHPPDASSDRNKSIELAQWSDLIIFDYLTANLDRIVNNLYNLQWNPGMMDAPAHNLARSAKSNLLVFLDNESGLLHGYRLLDKYESYHSILLNALCIFRKSTVDAVERLRRDKNLGRQLEAWLTAERDLVPALPDRSLKILNDRLDRVHDQVEWCRKQYS